MIQDFIRNKIVEVEPLSDGTLVVYWSLKDSLLDVTVELKVKPPDLEITEAKTRFRHLARQESSAAQTLVEKIVGVRIGAGIRKIVRGLLGGSGGSDLLTAAVLESSNAIILHFTRYTIQPGDYQDDEEKIAGARVMVEANPRMAGSCVVYADDSPVMQGLKR